MSNLRNEDTKMIKILSEKHVYSKGGIYGPVLTPFRETVANIFLMLLENIELSEVLPDGKEVKVTFQNFNKVNIADVEEDDEEEEVGSDEEPQPQSEPSVREEKHQHNQQQKNQKKFKEDKLNKK